jgi:tRNA-dihydrouridine synthase 1
MKRMRNEDTENIDHVNVGQNVHNVNGLNGLLGLNGVVNVIAPMVDNSDLAFRLLARKYGVQLSWTEMLYSWTFATSSKYRSNMFKSQLSDVDRPLVIQFAGNDSDTMLKAAKLAEPFVDAIDINLGCPQTCARKGGYGSFLLEQREKLFGIIEKLTPNLTKPLFCKIRLLPNLEDTIQLALGLQERGVQLITVHGRTKEQKGKNCGPPDWESVREIKKALHIPVISNGGIRKFSDIQDCLLATGCDGVMSAEQIMDNPALFSGEEPRRIDLFIEYLHNCKDHPPPGRKHINAHFFSMLRKQLDNHDDLRQKFLRTRQLDELILVAEEIRVRFESEIQVETTQEIVNITTIEEN